ncbi:MAG: DUF4835 family protein [Bacteroidales bacterium]|nr:DUF4835 family protein [Bacteroidales bacterium]MCF8403331.1 DUF4835 family protein [Bacteroidales bacterium]
MSYFLINKKATFLIGLLTLLFLESIGQEFLCNVQVNSQQIEGTDKRVFENMQTTITEFVNNRRWTNYEFKPEERIECNIVININERPSTDRFKATFNVVASRPVYRTGYNSPLLNYADKKFEFEYVEFQPMEFQENNYFSNLTSVLGFYLYTILGLDFDTFSEFGGTPFFEIAQSVVNAAQNSPVSGWQAFEDPNNRYWLNENYMNNTYSDLRKFLYEYHRLGLDVMSEKPDEGRAAISNSLKYLQKVHQRKTGLFALQLIIDAKRDEIVNIFSKGNPKEISEAQNIMNEIDPANSSTYSNMGKSK